MFSSRNLTHFIKSLDFFLMTLDISIIWDKIQSEEVINCCTKSVKRSTVTWISIIIRMLSILFEMSIWNVKKNVKLLLLRLISYLSIFWHPYPKSNPYLEFSSIFLAPRFPSRRKTCVSLVSSGKRIWCHFDEQHVNDMFYNWCYSNS